jgi:hypothetical protein
MRIVFNGKFFSSNDLCLFLRFKKKYVKIRCLLEPDFHFFNLKNVLFSFRELTRRDKIHIIIRFQYVAVWIPERGINTIRDTGPMCQIRCL